MAEEERVHRRLAAIVAADVVGYSRLMRSDETGTRARFNAELSDVIEPAIGDHRGRMVKTMGDGLLAEFDSVVNAVMCAVQIQNDIAAQQSGQAADQKLQFRIGIHLGDVIVEGDDIHGDGVNIAARLEEIATPGGICISDMVHAGVRNKLTVAFEDLGDQSLKNIADPVQVFRIVRPQAAADHKTPISQSVGRPAVAVLPFENLSGDVDQDYFADGLTEDLITALSLFRSFPVIARNSTFAYKGQSPDIRKVGEELGARYVVEGSVRKAGNRLRVTCQLINSETGHHIWAERYDRELEDIFALQDEISQRVAGIIEPTLARQEEQRTITKPTENLAAWDYCAQGNAYTWEWTKEANEKAREMFARAIELDPQYSRAYAGLARTYIREVRYFDSADKQDALVRVHDAARRAVSLDPSDAVARSVLSLYYAATAQPAASVAEAREAVKLNPHDAFSHNILGLSLSLSAARFEEGIPHLEKALQLSPLDPNNQIRFTHLALAHLCAGRYDVAAAHAQDAIQRRHDFVEAHVALASALGFLGRADEARAALKGYEDIAESSVLDHVIYAQEVKDQMLAGLRKAGLIA